MNMKTIKNKGEQGFSLLELLLVVLVIGIIAAIAVPHLQRAVRVAENGNMYATLRSVSTTQASFLAQNARYARLNEVNNLMSGAVGTESGNDLIRGKFVLSMVPANPTPEELATKFEINATRNIAGEGIIYVYVLNQSGLQPDFP